MDKMKVLHIYKDYFPVLGGIENHLRLLCTELAKDENFQVEVLVTNQGFRTILEKDKNLKIIKAGRLGLLASTPLSLSIFNWASKLKPDLIHLHFPYPLGEMATLLKGNSTRLVLTYHSDIVKQKKLLLIYRPFLKEILKRAKAVIVSNSNYIQTSDFLSEYKEKIQTIPFGIDLNRFSRKDERKVEQIKTKYPGPLILFVGKLRYYKGLNFLIESAKDVDGKVLIVGDGALRQELARMVKENNLDNKVFFAGEIPDEELGSYYQAADLFVLPSSHKSEAFGISLLEAMACGLPVISTELGTGTSFVNVHNKTGLVIPPGDSITLSKSINCLLQNRSLRDEFGKEAKERVEKHFRKEVMVSCIKKLYIETLKN